MVKLTFIFSWLCLLLATLSCSKSVKEDTTVIKPIDTTNYTPPLLNGKLIFHTYTCYECNDSKLYLYDFSEKKLTCISQDWDIDNPMNAHFSPDGSKIIFMGMPAGKSNWDVFLFRIGATSNPVNLTDGSATRDEDPKFSPNGTRIIYKQNGKLMEMDTTGKITKTISVPQAEASMPYYTRSGEGIVYSGLEKGKSEAGIYLYSVSEKTTKSLWVQPSIEAYYPITRDDTSYLFTRWNNTTNFNDQVFIGFFDGRSPRRLPFNDISNNYSDAYPVDSHTVILSSTRPGGMGHYDLYIADMNTGKIWSLTHYNSKTNTALNELGACYSPK